VVVVHQGAEEVVQEVEVAAHDEAEEDIRTPFLDLVQKVEVHHLVVAPALQYVEVEAPHQEEVEVGHLQLKVRVDLDLDPVKLAIHKNSCTHEHNFCLLYIIFVKQTTRLTMACSKSEKDINHSEFEQVSTNHAKGFFGPCSQGGGA